MQTILFSFFCISIVMKLNTLLLFSFTLLIINSCSLYEPPADKMNLIHFDCQTSEVTIGVAAEFIDSIADVGVLMGSAVSVAGTKPEQFERYERLLKVVNPEELESMCFHENPVVRAYAFQGMLETAHQKAFGVFRQLLQDTTSVRTMYGCTMDERQIKVQVLDLFYGIPAFKAHYQPRIAEKVFADSVLLSLAKSGQLTSYYHLASVYPVKKHYEPLKTIISDGYSEEPMVGLANFQKKSDLPLFLEAFDRRKFYDRGSLDLDIALQIVFRFPHPDFIPKLRSVQDYFLQQENSISEVESMNFYLAVLRYSPSTISSFIENLNASPDGYSKSALLDGLWLAAQLNNNPEKRKFIPAIERNEWLNYILSHHQKLVVVSDLQ